MEVWREVSRRDYSRIAGNRYSLRARSGHMIKRIDAVSKSLGALGDLLVTTWLGIAMAIVTLGIGAALIINAVLANNFATLVPNLPGIVLILVGSLLVALNVLMTNPSMGSQFIVSTKFLYRKTKNKSKGDKTIDFRPFRFAEGIDSESVVETIINGQEQYIVMYRVKGVVSPVTFDNDLNELARLDEQLLTNIEKDTVLATVNSVQASKVEPKKLPKNATEAMKRKRDINYAITSSLRYNQQLKTIVVLTAPNFDVLRARIESLENVFRKGLVIGYQRLQGKELKNAFNDIYG